MKKSKLRQLWDTGWQKLKDFDIKPAKPVVNDLFWQAEQELAQNNVAKAKFYLEKILANNKYNQDALFFLGGIYVRTGNLHAGEKHLLRAIKYYPNDADFYTLLGKLYSHPGRLKESVLAFEKALSLKPNCPKILHLLSAVQNKTSAKAPLDYIVDQYDIYADSFEQSLLRALDYKAHIALTQYIKDSQIINNCMTLDLGCGTGLLGQELTNQLKPARLVGVDLSPKMLAKAVQKNIYHELHNLDLVDYLQNSTRAYDLIAASDVLIYIGDLQEVFAQCYRRLKLGGIFGLSVEALTDGLFNLQPNGRYQHSLEYLRALSSSVGFSKFHNKTIDLRKEYGNIVPGFLVLLQK